jgi:hypothetical protein
MVRPLYAGTEDTTITGAQGQWEARWFPRPLEAVVSSRANVDPATTTASRISRNSSGPSDVRDPQSCVRRRSAKTVFGLQRLEMSGWIEFFRVLPESIPRKEVVPAIHRYFLRLVSDPYSLSTECFMKGIEFYGLTYQAAEPQVRPLQHAEAYQSRGSTSEQAFPPAKSAYAHTCSDYAHRRSVLRVKTCSWPRSCAG